MEVLVINVLIRMCIAFYEKITNWKRAINSRCSTTDFRIRKYLLEYVIEAYLQMGDIIKK